MSTTAQPLHETTTDSKRNTKRMTPFGAATRSLTTRLWIISSVGFLTGLIGASWALAQDAETTTIRLTDEVQVAETTRLGVNLGGDAYYSGAALVKRRANENFEGTMYRRCDFGPGYDREGVATWFSPSEAWRELIVGGQYTILSGPSQWSTGTVQGIDSRQYKHQGRMKPFDHYLVEHPIQTAEDRPVIGIMTERDRTRDGQMHRPDGYWCSADNEIAIGDVPPGVLPGFL